MSNDAKLGLVVGVGLVIAIGVVFFRKEPPSVEPAPAAVTPAAHHQRPVPAKPAAFTKSASDAAAPEPLSAQVMTTADNNP